MSVYSSSAPVFNFYRDDDDVFVCELTHGMVRELHCLLEEATTMAEEIASEGGLQYLAITFDNRILDDFVLLSDNNKYLSEEETKKIVDLYIGDWAIGLDAAASPDMGEPV